MMALAFALARATKVDEFQHIQGCLAELINHTEVIRSCVLASEIEATMSPYGILMPALGPVDAMRFMFPQMFRRACEIIQLIGAGGIFMAPSFAEIDGPLAADVENLYQAANADSRSTCCGRNFPWRKSNTMSPELVQRSENSTSGLK